MIVCHCRVVNERTVVRAIGDGAHTVAEIGAQCGAGTDCGACHPELERLLSERARRLAGVGAAGSSFSGWRSG